MEATEFLGGSTPLEKLTEWIEHGRAQGLKEPLSMTVSTVDAQGQPDSRIVLAKEIRPEGLVFYTNYNSPKGRQTNDNPKVAVNFYWDGKLNDSPGRQVRIKGKIERIPSAQSDAYWNARPRESQVSQYLSQQSEPIESREELEAQYQKVDAEFAGQSVPRPEHWGGYLIRPMRIEFWMGDPRRFHDRFVYQWKDGAWQAGRLYP